MIFQIQDRIIELGKKSGYPDSSVGIILASLVYGNRPETILEVGYHLGFSACCMCAGAELSEQPAKMLSVDIQECDQGKIVQSFGFNNHTFLQGNSYLVRSKVQAILGPKIDFLFLDGDHTYEGLKGDWNTYSPMLSDKGLAVFHDVYAVAMKKVIDELDTKWNVTYLGGWASLSLIRADKYHKSKHDNYRDNTSLRHDHQTFVDTKCIQKCVHQSVELL